MNNCLWRINLAWFTLVFAGTLSSAHADEKEIRSMLESKFSKRGRVEHIIKTPYAGLYEIHIGDQLIYSDEKGEYLFDGSVIDVKNGVNVTEERHSELIAVDFDKLPLELAMKKVKGGGKRKMAVFTDPNCPFCKGLERELAKVSDVTIYIFLYPIFPNSAEIARNVQCAKDPVNAWDEWMANGVAPAEASCQAPIDKVMGLGKKLRIKTTPNLIFADGKRAPGYLSAEEVEKRLGETGKN